MQGAEALEPTPSVVSRIAIGAESTSKTTRTGGDHYLASVARIIYPEAVYPEVMTTTESMRSRWWDMLKLEHSLLLSAIGPRKGEEDDRPPRHTCVDWSVPL